MLEFINYQLRTKKNKWKSGNDNLSEILHVNSNQNKNFMLGSSLVVCGSEVN